MVLCHDTGSSNPPRVAAVAVLFPMQSRQQTYIHNTFPHVYLLGPPIQTAIDLLTLSEPRPQRRKIDPVKLTKKKKRSNTTKRLPCSRVHIYRNMKRMNT